MEMIFVWIFLMSGSNIIGNVLSRFFEGRCFALKGSVFTKFQVHITQQLSKCDFEC